MVFRTYSAIAVTAYLNRTEITIPNGIMIKKEDENNFLISDSKGSFKHISNSANSIDELKNNLIYIQLEDKNKCILYIGDSIVHSFDIEYKNNQRLVYSEFILLNNILSEYRNLRENFEFNLRYEEAGELFKREMELKRKYKQLSKEPRYVVGSYKWIYRNFSLTGLYYHLFNYGESFFRPLVIFVLPFFIFSLFYFILLDSGSMFLNNDYLNEVRNFIKNGHISENTESLIKTLLLPIIATLFIPLRRRFERRFRH